MRPRDGTAGAPFPRGSLTTVPRQFFGIPGIALLLGSLLALDGMFMLLHGMNVLQEYLGQSGAFSDRRFSIEQDGGFAERYEYAKTIACSLFLLGCHRRTGQPVYLALAATFALALLDNALRLHEQVGELAAPSLQSLRQLFESAPEALSETAFLLVLGLLVAGGLGLGFARSTQRHRIIGASFVAVLIVLGGFGIAIDLLHSIAGRINLKVDRVFGFIEDGGELVVLSLACAMSCAAFLHFRAPERPYGTKGLGPSPIGVRADRP